MTFWGTTRCPYLESGWTTLSGKFTEIMCDTLDNPLAATITTSTSPTTATTTTTSPSFARSFNSKSKTSTVFSADVKIAKKKAKKQAAKVARITRKEYERELLECCEGFTRVYHMEGRHRFQGDDFGVICCTDAKGDITCSVSVMQFLLDNKQLHSTEGDSATKCFYESHYDRISNFPEHLERFALVIQNGAKLARLAKIGEVKAANYNEDDDSNEDDE